MTSIKYAAINTFLHVLVSPDENFVILRTKMMINLNRYTPISFAYRANSHNSKKKL